MLNKMLADNILSARFFKNIIPLCFLCKGSQCSDKWHGAGEKTKGSREKETAEEGKAREIKGK